MKPIALTPLFISFHMRYEFSIYRNYTSLSNSAPRNSYTFIAMPFTMAGKYGIGGCKRNTSYTLIIYHGERTQSFQSFHSMTVIMRFHCIFSFILTQVHALNAMVLDPQKQLKWFSIICFTLQQRYALFNVIHIKLMKHFCAVANLIKCSFFLLCLVFGHAYARDRRNMGQPMPILAK